MALQEKVREFMTKSVESVFSDSNVSNAVRIMVDHNVGSVIVKDNQGTLGIFTERDLLSKVLANHRKLEDPILMEVMTSSFNVVPSESTLIEAAKIMSEKKGRLLVFDDGNLIGIVTVTDIVRKIHSSGKAFGFEKTYSGKICEEVPEAKLERIVRLMVKRRIGSVIISGGKLPRGIFTERDLLRSSLDRGFNLDTAVGEYTTHPIITARMGIDGREAAAIMVNNHIKRLPLTKSDRILGIVTARDLVEAFAGSA